MLVSVFEPTSVVLFPSAILSQQVMGPLVQLLSPNQFIQPCQLLISYLYPIYSLYNAYNSLQCSGNPQECSYT